MTPSQHEPGQYELHKYLDAARRGWRVRVLVRGLLRGVAAAGLLAGALALLALTGAAPWIAAWGPGGEIARLAPWLPVAGFLLVLLPALYQALLRAPDARALALRAEEVEPGLDHLPSLLLGLPLEHPYAAELFREGEARLRGRDPGRPAGPWGRGGEVAVLVGAVALGAVSVMGAGGPEAVRAAWTPPATIPGAQGPEVGFAGDDGAHALSHLQLRVTPPAYTGLDPFDLPVEEGVRALAGSRIELHGSMPALVEGAEAPHVTLLEEAEGSRSLEVVSDPGGWSVDRILAEGDRGLLLTASTGNGVRERVIPLEPLIDAAPSVTLLEPERDLVLATGTGEVTFRALAHDPYGIDSFRLSWVHTRGSGESFDFREGTVDWSQVARNGSEVEGTVTLRLEELGLGPGDVLHLRALATDGNHVTGPGTGVSGTRQIRVIREGDEMLVDALIGFPLEGEQDPVLSQRMILLLTEDLLTRAPTLARGELRREAEELADEQARLRAEVGEQVFSRATGAMEPTTEHLGGGEHTHGDELGGHDAHTHDALAHAGGATAARGSTYGVAAIFDPSVAEREREREREAQAALARAATFQDEAGTQVGNYTLGDATRMPTGFGIVDELGHQHDGDPILSVNEPLLSIYNHMWESERHLRLAEPSASVPYQEEALAELQELRDGNRVFARGRVTAPPVDVAEVRGTGEVDDAAPAPRGPGTPRPGSDRWIAELERSLTEPGQDPAGALTRLAVGLLGDRTAPVEAGSLVARAADHAREGETDRARELLLEALERLDPSPPRAAASRMHPAPPSPLAAWAPPPTDEPATDVPDATGPPPFVFATLRYESGNWDSAPLVPQNLIHSLAQYTELPVEPEGVVVDLSSRDIFGYPVLYLTGHLPVRFSDAEARNLKAYVERGGFVFMDDHNHDIDGAFHQTATAELARIFGEDALEPLPNDHELYRTFFHFEDGPPTTSHELSGWGDGLIHPELHAVVVDGRIGILYSNKDYSSEWSYHAVNKRFLAVDNTRFGVNLLLYALTR